MDQDSLTKLLAHATVRLKNGEQVEESKLELKRQWPHFKSTSKDSLKVIQSEFLKDLVALANKPGPEGYLVFGIDGKTGEVFDSQFKQSGLKDIVELRQLVVKYVDLPVDFELIELQMIGKTISVLIVPPSVNKPHFITHYVTSKGIQIDNFIPIRKTTAVFPATRSDVELMYYDRKNVEPEYALNIFTYNPHISVNGSQGVISVDFQMVFENYGRKPIVIVKSTMTIDAAPEAGIPRDVVLSLTRYSEHSVQDRESFLSNRFLTVPSNQVATLMVKYQDNIADDQLRPIREHGNFLFSIIVQDSHGNKYHSKKFTRVYP
ncbi:MAG: ATP-binding protein [Bacteroidota bacterium]|nr:ATP-binding protein [Bacteroidota bacterium]